MKAPTIAERTADALRSLQAALAGRADHAQWCGLVTKPVYGALSIGWRDSLANESGNLAIVPRKQAPIELLSALFEFITDWKAQAAAARGVLPEKEAKHAEREKCVRRLDPPAHRRTVARRAAAR